MIEAVIFDMDGVIVDTEPVYYKRLQDFMQHNGVEAEVKDLNRIVGSSSTDTWRIIQEIWGEELDQKKYSAEYEDFYREHPIRYDEIVDPDIYRVLDWLKEERFKIGLASSSSLPNIQQVLQECNLTHYFDSILSGEMFHQSKPNPEIYLKSAEKLEVEPEKCLAVEDSTYGITAGKAAGMFVVAKEDNRFNFEQHLADKKIKRLTEVISVLK